MERALQDASVTLKDIEAAAVGSTSYPKGQRVLYEMNLTGIPIFNVAYACATGSNALYLARPSVESGMHDVCLAIGIEIMHPGPLTAGIGRGAGALDFHMPAMATQFAFGQEPAMPQMFGSTWWPMGASRSTTPGSAGRTTGTP